MHKNYDKNKESSYHQHCDVSNFSPKLPVNTFEWLKYTSQYN